MSDRAADTETVVIGMATLIRGDYLPLIKLHVSQKPVALMRWVIGALRVPPNSLILDPCMGSGSTGLAALSMGHRFVGIEYDEAHFATACARLKQYDDTLTFQYA